jgi:predicted dehydrogenase
MANERVIVIGAGGISGAWLPSVVREGLQVVAIVDLNREAAERRIDEYKLAGAIASNDLDAVLRDHRADFAIDLTVPDAHCDVTCRALRAGLHVVGEKPMAASMGQAREMIRASEESGRLLMTSQSRRWESKHATIAATVRAGRLGRLTTVNCDFFIGAHFGGFRDEMDSPLILDMAIHHFDLVRQFTRLNARSVYCEEFNPVGSWYRGDVSANCLFELDEGVRFAYRGSWCAEGCHTSWNGDWRLIGTDGTLLYAGEGEPRGEVVDGAMPRFNLPTVDMRIDKVMVEKTGMHGALAEMLDFIRQGKTPQTECHDNIHSLAMVHAAIASSREGRRVTIDEVG